MKRSGSQKRPRKNISVCFTADELQKLDENGAAGNRSGYIREVVLGDRGPCARRDRPSAEARRLAKAYTGLNQAGVTLKSIAEKLAEDRAISSDDNKAALAQIQAAIEHVIDISGN
jgi:hypothetical protein